MSTRNGTVKTGIDVLEDHGFDVLKVASAAGSSSTTADEASAAPRAEPKKRIGVVTNQTGIDSQGLRTIDVLAKAPGVSLDAIFSTEHGVTGTLDTTTVNNSVDAATGVPVYSVYGGPGASRRSATGVTWALVCVVS